MLSTTQRQHGHEKFRKNCVFFGRIPGYWILAAHSGPANHFTPLIRPVIASRDVAEAIYGVPDG